MDCDVLLRTHTFKTPSQGRLVNCQVLRLQIFNLAFWKSRSKPPTLHRSIDSQACWRLRNRAARTFQSLALGATLLNGLQYNPSNTIRLLVCPPSLGSQGLLRKCWRHAATSLGFPNLEGKGRSIYQSKVEWLPQPPENMAIYEAGCYSNIERARAILAALPGRKVVTKYCTLTQLIR